MHKYFRLLYYYYMKYNIIMDAKTQSFIDSNVDVKSNILNKILPTLKKVLHVSQKVVNIATII
jgi:hypothetical protein